LAHAAAHGRVLPLYVIEPELWRQPDMSARQWEFVSECLSELREELGKLGQPLIVCVGDVTDVLDDFLNELAAPDDFSSKAISVNRSSKLWMKGVIPYRIDPSISASKRTNILNAIQHLNAKTNLNIIPRTNQRNFIHFFSGSGCWSYVGRIGGGQKISIGNYCDFGAVVHEICHAAGLFHEQSRSDRDRHVNIYWSNIDRNNAHNFKQHISDGMDIGPYDYESIMHYSNYAFSINGKPTISAKNGRRLGQRKGLSPYDIAAINQLYKTGNTTTSPPRPNTTEPITAAVNRWSGKSYFFRNNKYIRYDNSSFTVDRGYPKKVFGSWGSINWGIIDAALSRDNGKIYLFKGNQYARYDIANYAIDAGYPKDINYGWTGLPWTSVDAAVSRGDDKVYFFKGNQYVRYDFQKLRVDPGYPKTINYGWTGVGWNRIDAALNYGNKKIYLFKGDSYVRYDLRKGRVDAGYPKTVKHNWYGL
ncbi:MAG: M12 family metallopeptidase, partial [Bacteroidota bacterium]